MKKIVFIVILSTVFSFSNFVRNNGVVIDKSTGLIWQDDYSDNNGNIKYSNWEEAIEYCEKLRLADFDDWRLPNIRELKSLLDYSQTSYRFDPSFINIKYAGYYWSSTSVLSSPAKAYRVNFWRDGTNTTEYKLSSDSTSVRCVRDDK